MYVFKFLRSSHTGLWIRTAAATTTYEYITYVDKNSTHTHTCYMVFDQWQEQQQQLQDIQTKQNDI